jgi:hypothetical protein
MEIRTKTEGKSVSDQCNALVLSILLGTYMQWSIIDSDLS